MRLAVERLSVRDGAVALVAPVDFAVEPGRVLAIIGETGSGKSLIAQALFGLLPDRLTATGTMRIGDTAHVPSPHPALFLLPQEPMAALDPTMRVGAQIAEMGGDPALAAASVDLDRAALRQYPAALSGGMAQRALVAMAALSGAGVIVADEPTKNLDAARRDQVIALLRRLRDDGRALIVITHDLDVAALGDDVMVMRDGVVVEQGPATHVLAAPAHDYTRAYLAAHPRHWTNTTAAKAGERVAALRHVAFGYGTMLFEDLNLHLQRGQIHALVGPSGVGKTTAGDVLLGLRRPMRGTVEWHGRDLWRMASGERSALRHRFQKLHQDPVGVFSRHRPIARAFADLALVLADDPVPRLPALLDRLKLRPELLDRYPGEISGGEAQRLALARLLLLEPWVIVADEPTSRLDPPVQAETIGLLRDLVARERLAVLLISHDAAMVRAVADQVTEMG